MQSPRFSFMDFPSCSHMRLERRSDSSISATRDTINSSILTALNRKFSLCSCIQKHQMSKRRAVPTAVSFGCEIQAAKIHSISLPFTSEHKRHSLCSSEAWASWSPSSCAASIKRAGTVQKTGVPITAQHTRPSFSSPSEPRVSECPNS